MRVQSCAIHLIGWPDRKPPPYSSPGAGTAVSRLQPSIKSLLAKTFVFTWGAAQHFYSRYLVHALLCGYLKVHSRENLTLYTNLRLCSFPYIWLIFIDLCCPFLGVRQSSDSLSLCRLLRFTVTVTARK